MIRNAYSPGTFKAAASEPDLLREVERYLARTGMAASRLGRDAANNAALIADLRRGRIGPKTAAKLRKYMADNPC